MTLNTTVANISVTYLSLQNVKRISKIHQQTDHNSAHNICSYLLKSLLFLLSFKHLSFKHLNSADNIEFVLESVISPLSQMYYAMQFLSICVSETQFSKSLKKEDPGQNLPKNL